jgi:hypothetical protein
MSSKELNEQLLSLAEQFENAKIKMSEVVSGLDRGKFNQRPSYGGWSVAECINHLIVTDTDYTAQIENGLKIAKDKNLFSDGPFKIGWLGRKFIGNVEPPVKRKLKAPKKWTPSSDLSLEEVTSAYIKYQDKYIELLKNSSGLDIGKVKLPSPATDLLRFSVFVMFNINAAHQRRHLWQAENVKKNILN